MKVKGLDEKRLKFPCKWPLIKNHPSFQTTFCQLFSSYCHENEPLTKDWFSSVQSFDQFDLQGDMRDDFLHATVSSSGMCRDIHSFVLSIQHFLSDHSVAHPSRCPEGWFGRNCYRAWHPKPCKFLPLDSYQEIPMDPQGSWSSSAPSCGSCAPSRRCRVSSGTWFWKPVSFFQSQGPCFTATEEDGLTRDLYKLNLLAMLNRCHPCTGLLLGTWKGHPL